MKAFILLLISTAAISLTACNQKSSTDISEKTQKQYKDFKVEMSQKIAVLDKKIEKLKEKDKSSDAKKTLKSKVDDLGEIRESLSEQMEEMSDASKDSFVDLKSKVENSYNNLESEVEKAFN